MIDVKDYLRAGDPLEVAAAESPRRRAMMRDAVVNALLRRQEDEPERLAFATRLRLVLGTIGMLLFLGTSIWHTLEKEVFAAVRFEVRLAETAPAPGLREAPVGAQPRIVYLHEETIVTNDHIARVAVTPMGANFAVEVALSPTGAARLREATRGHVDRPIALMLDGLVVMAPTVRSEIGEVGRISGDFSREEAEHLARALTSR